MEADARNAAVFRPEQFESPPTDAPRRCVVSSHIRTGRYVTLSFDLELTGRQFPQDIKVSMPSVRGRRAAARRFDILAPTRSAVQQTNSRGVQRIRVTSEADLSVAATAFRMRSPESLIVLHVEETEAQFACPRNSA